MGRTRRAAAARSASRGLKGAGLGAIGLRAERGGAFGLDDAEHGSQVAGGGDPAPFEADFFASAQKEVADSEGLFDEAKGAFGDGGALFVDGLALFAGHAAGHFFTQLHATAAIGRARRFGAWLFS